MTELHLENRSHDGTECGKRYTDEHPLDDVGWDIVREPLHYDQITCGVCRGALAALETWLIAQAQDLFMEYGLPMTEYDAKIDWGTDAITCEVLFTHRTSGLEIALTEVWSDDFGNITQRGTNYGRLSI